jgi:DNA-binding CsgD family transcriptional regulator
VNDAHLFPGERAIDLSRLNDGERRVLRLLAEGHTAKSIAVALGSTPAAVNERLREARRKTGVGSSRELARLLKSQENRHEQMGVASGRPSVAVVPQPVAEPWRPQTGVIAMIALILVAAAGATVMMSHQPNTAMESPSTSVDKDPLFSSILAERDATQLFGSGVKTRRDMDRELQGEGIHSVLRQLHEKVHSEPRNQAWASTTENGLRAAFASIPNVGVQGTELRVLCGSTLCEIAGTLDGPAKTKVAMEKFNRATMRRLNPKALEPQTDKLGLKSMVASLGTMTGDRMSYVFYYSRKS